MKPIEKGFVGGGLIVRNQEPLPQYYRMPTRLPGGHRFLSFLGKFGFASDEAVAYNYYAAYYLGGPLNRITEWEHDLDESYLERWEEKERPKPSWRRI